MSSRSIPQTQCASAPNLADLLAMLEAGSFPERKRQEMASAIRTIARALGRPQEEIPANGRLLASRLKDVSPAAIGISTGRWNNVRSLLRNALSFIEPIPPGRNRNDLSAEWHTLYNKLGSRSDKIALSRVVHFLSAHGIRPGEVTEETFNAYQDHLDRSLLKRPAQTFALTVRAWRRAEATVEGAKDHGLDTQPP